MAALQGGISPILCTFQNLQWGWINGAATKDTSARTALEYFMLLLSHFTFLPPISLFYILLGEQRCCYLRPFLAHLSKGTILERDRCRQKAETVPICPEHVYHSKHVAGLAWGPTWITIHCSSSPLTGSNSLWSPFPSPASQEPSCLQAPEVSLDENS